jgi:NADP-dependent 3-hydroxy acid dehydrogenase YdfG
MNQPEFADKVVLITGASSGIGKACAFEFAANGSKVVLAARNEDELLKVKNSIINLGGEASIKKTDVRSIEDCKYLINNVVEKYGKIDVLVNNAGISMRASFEDLDLQVIKAIMDTNFYGAVTVQSLRCLPSETKRDCNWDFLNSGLTPLPGRTGYCASKHAMDGFFNTLRIENNRKGLNVLVVHPGFTCSNIRNMALDKNGQTQKETPRDEAKMMPSGKVALIITEAVLKRKRDLILTSQENWLLLYRNFPV